MLISYFIDKHGISVQRIAFTVSQEIVIQNYSLCLAKREAFLYMFHTAAVTCMIMSYQLVWV